MEESTQQKLDRYENAVIGLTKIIRYLEDPIALRRIAAISCYALTDEEISAVETTARELEL